MPHSSIAANFDGQHGKTSVAAFATARMSDSTAEHYCKPEGKANTDPGASFVSAEARQGGWHESAVAPHGRDENTLHGMATAAQVQSRLKAARHHARDPRHKFRFLSAHCHCAAWLAPRLTKRLNSHAASIAPLRHAGPNPSLKRSANGMPPAPVRGAEHFPQPGAGVIPLSPA